MWKTCARSSDYDRPSLMISFLLRAAFLSTLLPVTALAQPPSPQEVRDRITALTDLGRYDAPAVVILDQTDVTVRPNGIGVATTCRLVRILKDGAIRSEAVQRFPFDPTTNTLQLEAVRVHRADGRVEDLPADRAVDQPEPQGSIYWGSRQLMIEIGRLGVGDTLETRVTKTGFNVAYLASTDHATGGGPDALEPPMPGHWYDEVTFYSTVPILEKRYTVRTPKDKPIQYEVYNGEVRSAVKMEGDHLVYTFVKNDIAPFEREPGMIAPTDALCKVVLATLPDWTEKSRWFYEKNEPSFAVDDAIRAKVAEITRGLSTDEEKITALNHWVAENIRYVGTSRGACEGYTTHPVVETFHDRGGVCKDKAGLLVAMLREAGFESYIVMTQAGSDVMPIPADQFNHAVTSIRLADGSFRLLDPTWMPKSRENWSSAEQLQHVVHGTPEGQPLMRSPYSGPENNAITWTGRTTLTEDGAWRGEMTLTTCGVPETNLRRAAARVHPDQRAGLVEDAFAALSPGTRLAEASMTDPVDFSGPMTVHAVFETPWAAIGDEGHRWVSLPMFSAIFGDTVCGDVWSSFGLEKRRYPARIRSTRRLTFAETITLPEGFRPVALPEAKRLDGPAADLTFTLEHRGNEIRYQCTVNLKKHRVPVDEYAQFREVLRTLESLQKTRLHLTRESNVATR